MTQANGSRTRYIRTYHRPSHCLPQRVAKKICRRALLFVGRSAKACVGRLLTARSGHACPLDLPSPVPPTTRVSPISNFKPLRSYPHASLPRIVDEIIGCSNSGLPSVQQCRHNTHNSSSSSHHRRSHHCVATAYRLAARRISIIVSATAGSSIA